MISRLGIVIRAAKFFPVLMFCVGLSACVKQGAEPEPVMNSGDMSPDHYTHTVRYSGETLGIIAGWYTGSSRNWESIASANPGLQPERINIGQQINIPASILVRDQPLSEEYVRKFYSASGQQAGGTASMDAPADDDKPVADSGDKPMDSSGKQDDPFAALLGDDGSSDNSAPKEAAAPDKKSDDTDALLKELTSDEPAAKPAVEPPKAAAGDDEAERERLLDELLGE